MSSEPASRDTSAKEQSPVTTPYGRVFAGPQPSFGNRGLLEHFSVDLNFAWRQLYRNPGFSVVAVLTLALGIGAVLAVFQTADKALFQPLPYPDADRIVMLWGHDRSTPDQRALVSAGEVQAFDQSKIFTAIAGIDLKQLSYALTGAGKPQQVAAVHVSPGFFQILGVQPLLGQGFHSGAAGEGNDTTAIISYHLWTEHFRSDPGVIGKPLDLDGQSYTIVGVMPAGFSFPIRYQDEDIEAWMPESLDPMLSSPVMRHFGTLLTFARMPPGVSLASEQEQLNAIQTQLRSQFPAMNQAREVGVYALTGELAGPHRTELLLLMGAVVILFLITCSNVANLLISRGHARSQELAVRVALGAGRAALMRQLMTENILLACLGAIGSIIVAVLGARALSEYVRRQPGGAGFAHLLSAPALNGHGVSAGAFLVMAGVLAVTFLLAAAAPAIALSATDGLAAIGGLGRTTIGKRTHRMRTISIVSQVSLSLFLAVGAILLVQSFERFIRIDPGFQVEHRLTYQLTLPQATYPRARQAQFFNDFGAKVRALPGVESAALIGGLPLTSWMKMGKFLPDSMSVTRAADLLTAQTRSVSANYFSVMGIPFVSGTTFREGSQENSPAEVVISQSLARQYWPQASAIGRTLKFDLDTDSPAYTVVGVVEDVHQNTLDQNTGAEYYLSYWNGPDRSMGLIVKTPLDKTVMDREIEASLHAIDPDLPFAHVASFDELVREASRSQRTRFILLSLISGAALLLTAVGVFGLISYLVQQRTREIGIRLALGSGRGRIIFKILKDVMLLVFLGIGTGIIIALMLARFIEHLLFNVSVLNPLIYFEAVVLLIAVALTACAIPALRAARIEPAIALRIE